MWASQKENTDKRKYVILKYKYVGKKPLEDSNEKRTIRGQYLEESRIERADDRIPNTSQVNYTYIVKCSDETLYTGWTNNLEKRLRAHNSGKGAKYTKNRRPVELVYFEEYDTKQEAMKREYAIKQLPREKKLALIRCCQSIF